jgi:hypothetical protein
LNDQLAGSLARRLLHILKRLGRAAHMRDGHALHWNECSWPGIAIARARGMGMVILLIGATTKQQGHHLPSGMDTIAAVPMAEETSALTGISVLPVVVYGCLRAVPPRCLRSYVRRCARQHRRQIGCRAGKAWRRSAPMNHSSETETWTA